MIARRLRARRRPSRKSPRPAASCASALDKIFAASDAQISEKLRELVAGKQLDKHLDRTNERKAVESFYAARNYAPLWIMDGALTARAKATIARLKDAAADGLDAADYPVPNSTG